MAHSLEEIAQLLYNTHFKRCFIGGMDGEDVWNKLGRLHKEYEEHIQALQQQHLGVVLEYSRRMAQQKQRLEARIAQLEQALSQQSLSSGADTGYLQAATQQIPGRTRMLTENAVLCAQTPQQDNTGFAPLNGQAAYSPQARQIPVGPGYINAPQEQTVSSWQAQQGAPV